jgi:hypothetical protein
MLSPAISHIAEDGGMDTKVAKDTIKVIRKEQKRRWSRLPDHQDAAYDQWLFIDEPFVNDLYLMLLVAIRHQVERELVRLAAQMTGDGKALSREQYQTRIQDERRLLRNKDGWKKLVAKLKLKSCAEWDTSMESLRLLANSYKHEPSGRPDNKLLKHLKLDLKRKYAPLPESSCVREGLAVSINLQKNADYGDIAEGLLKRSDRFLAAVKQQSGLSEVKSSGRLQSFSPDDFEC